jgi:methionine-rich copper-binding protein CopC
VGAEARGPGLEARRPGLPLAVAAALALAAGACAYAADPPGGPPDTTPPQLVASKPESGAVLARAPRDAELDFDEVVNERIAAQRSDIAGAVILSPASGRVSVGWHRTRLTVSMRGGFLAGRVYRLELLPVITDLRQNRMKTGRTIIFSTGPAIPAATLRGAVVDWAAGRAAGNALLEAVLLPDSLPYRALADSAGAFALAQLPPGPYLVYGVLDQNGNRDRDPREAFDTARVTLTDSASVELYAFTRDTVGPRPRSAEFVDSTTFRVIFDRPLLPSGAVDTTMLHVAPADDTTHTLPVSQILTPAAYDSVAKAAAAARLARDTAEHPPAAAPAPPRAAPGAIRPARGARAAPPPLPPAQRPESTEAMKMLARRPAPTDGRVVRLATPLEPGRRYVVTTAGVLGLTGVAGHGRVQLVVPRPRPARTTADTSRAADTTRADTSRAADTSRTRAPPDSARSPRPRPR